MRKDIITPECYHLSVNVKILINKEATVLAQKELLEDLLNEDKEELEDI